MPSVSTSLLAIATAVSSASAAYQGFNYGATFTNGAPKVQTDFENEFKTAAGLEGTNGAFTSARIFTLVQAGTASDPSSAIPAAISTKTSLLFGLWASAGEASFNNEITALQTIISQYCSQLNNLVAGISVGSEDLYRISPTGIAAGSNPGADPNTLVGYISRVRETIKDSCLKDIPIGHVDTWTAYVNGTNKPVIDAIDFIGFDAYPYFEDTKTNPVGEGKNLFQSALDQTRAVVGNKPIWITETGWPVSGKVSGQAVASIENARSYWTQVGCSFFNTTNVWWYTLQDASPDTPNPSFGVVGSTLSTKPIYDLSCPAAAAKRDEVPRQVPAGAKRSWNIARQNEAGNSSVTPAGTATSTGSGNVPLSTGSSGSGSGIGSGSPGSGSQGGSGSDSGSGSPTGEAGSNSINSYSAVVVALFLAIMIL